MSHQPEVLLENNLAEQLTGLGYAYATIKDEDAILFNLKGQLEKFNGLQLTDKEFTSCSQSSFQRQCI